MAKRHFIKKWHNNSDTRSNIEEVLSDFARVTVPQMERLLRNLFNKELLDAEEVIEVLGAYGGYHAATAEEYEEARTNG